MSTPRVVLAPQLLQKLPSKKQPLSCTNLVGENVRESGTPGETTTLRAGHAQSHRLRTRPARDRTHRAGRGMTRARTDPRPRRPEHGAVLAGIKAKPSGWPTASPDPGCGRRRPAPVEGGHRGRSTAQDPPNKSLYGIRGLPSYRGCRGADSGPVAASGCAL